MSTEIEVMSLCFYQVGVRVMVFNTTFNNNSVISWQSVLLVEETGIPRENHQPLTNYDEPWNPSPHIKRQTWDKIHVHHHILLTKPKSSSTSTADKHLCFPSRLYRATLNIPLSVCKMTVLNIFIWVCCSKIFAARVVQFLAIYNEDDIYSTLKIK